MAKLTAWLVTLMGVFLVLALLIPDTFSGDWFNWVIALAVLIIGVGKLMRNYKMVKKR